jgi:hypothetical protein
MGVIWISHVLVLQKVVMSPFTRTNVCFGVWKQIVGTEGEQVKLANLKQSDEYSTYILVIEVIALSCDTDLTASSSGNTDAIKVI